LAAADELFYGGGINLVGIDRVIEHAGVAKASLYDCFGSKEELIRSYLQARNEIRQARIRDRLSRHTTPLDKILSIFELQAEVVAQPNFRGCAFLRAGADADEGGKIKQVCDQSPSSACNSPSWRERLEFATPRGSANSWCSYTTAPQLPLRLTVTGRLQSPRRRWRGSS